MSITVATFYRFVDLPDYVELRAILREIAQEHKLLGTILVAPEGLNSTLCGARHSLLGFFAEIGKDERLANLETKFSECTDAPFARLRVRLKKEIVRMKAPDADPRKGVGIYVDPKDWNELLQRPDTVTIDVRNDYEIEEGTFEGAINPETADFWEFPAWVEANLKDKEQPLALFCTGGIRCERATAYLVARGYRYVHHLQGGILNYLAQIDRSESLWRGACFVFDDRWSLDHDLKPTKVKSGTGS